MDDFEKEFMGETAAPQQPAGAAEDRQPAAAPAAGMPDFESEFYGRVPRPSAAVTRPSAVGAATSATPQQERPSASRRPMSMTQMARRPAAPEEPDLTVGEAFRQAGTNLLPSIGNVFRTTGEAILNPAETLEGIKTLGVGALSKAKRQIGVQQDAKQAAQDERVLNALIDQYKQTYGSEQGFLRALAKDPASVAMDLSTFVTGGGTAAAKLAGTTTRAGKAAATAANIASKVDPIQLALTAAKTPLVGATVLGRKTPSIAGATRVAQTVLTSIPKPLLDAAEEAGRTTDPALRETFLRFRSGQGSASEFQTAAQAALAEERRAAQAQYLAGRGNLANRQLDLADVMSTLTNQEQLAARGSQHGWRERRAALAEARNMIEDLVTDPDPMRRNLDNVDALKQQLYELGDMYPSAKGPISDIYKSVRNTLANPARGGDVGYSRLMEQYQEGRNTLRALAQDLALGERASASSAVTKALKQMRTGRGENLFGKLAQRDPHLLYMLSGMAVQPWTTGGARSLIDALATTPALFFGGPKLAAAQFAAASPRVAGSLQYATGAARRYGKAATQQAIATPTYYAGRVREELPTDLQPVEPQEPEKEKPEYEPFYSSAQGEGERRVPAENAVPQEVIERILEKEGRGQNPEGSAYGPFQFVDDTWREQVRKHFPEVAQGMSDDELNALKKTPEGERIAMQLGPIFINENAQFLEQNGFPATPGNIYLAHFFGPTGAVKALEAARNNPDTPVVDIVGQQAVKQNRRVLEGKTVGDVLAWTDSQMQMASGGRIGRKSGGRVQSVDSLVDDLMRRAQKAKKEVNKMTEPLLNQPDETIAHALDVAQRAI